MCSHGTALDQWTLRKDDTTQIEMRSVRTFTKFTHEKHVNDQAPSAQKKLCCPLRTLEVSRSGSASASGGTTMRRDTTPTFSALEKLPHPVSEARFVLQNIAFRASSNFQKRISREPSLEERKWEKLKVEDVKTKFSCETSLKK